MTIKKKNIYIYITFKVISIQERLTLISTATTTNTLCLVSSYRFLLSYKHSNKHITTITNGQY